MRVIINHPVNTSSATASLPAPPTTMPTQPRRHSSVYTVEPAVYAIEPVSKKSVYSVEPPSITSAYTTFQPAGQPLYRSSSTREPRYYSSHSRSSSADSACSSSSHGSSHSRSSSVKSVRFALEPESKVERRTESPAPAYGYVSSRGKRSHVNSVDEGRRERRESRGEDLMVVERRGRERTYHRGGY